MEILYKLPNKEAQEWKYEEEFIYNRHTQILHIEENKTEKELVKKMVNKNIKPLDLVIRLTNNIQFNKDYIKDELIKLISDKKYIKIFGLKKSSEILAGLSGNIWNSSTVLFLSFILDISINYETKEIKFYKDREYKSNIII